MSNLRSMTAFGSGASVIAPGLKIDVRSVNHRFLDVNVKLPAGAERYEAALVKKIRETLRRGRIDVFVRREVEGAQKRFINFNEELLSDAFRALSQGVSSIEPGLADERNAILSALLRRPEVLSFEGEEIQATLSEEGLLEALDCALTALAEMRDVEGANLQKTLLGHITELETLCSLVEPLVKEARLKFSARVQARLAELALTIPEDRLALEVAILAERMDVSEELERLVSHISQFRTLLSDGGEVGKKLDFLVQEMNREVNTTGSKSQSSEVTKIVIEAKSLLERIREQIQNIE